MAIQVTLQDYTGTTQRQVKLNTEASVGELIHHIASALQLPNINAEGEEIPYFLRRQDHFLENKRSLKEQNIQENDVITIMPRLRDIERNTQNVKAVTSLINVTATGRPPQRIPLDSGETVTQLIPAITASLRLPVADAGGRSIMYRLRYNGRLLGKHETLEGVDFTDSDMLVLESQLPTTSNNDFELMGGPWNPIAEDESPDFLISYHYDNFSWADWVCTQLQEYELCTVRLFDCDKRKDDSYSKKMRDAVEIAGAAKRVIAIISRQYLKSPFALAQLNTVAERDRNGEQELLLPVYIEDCGDELVGA